MSESDLIDCPHCGIQLDEDASAHYGILGYCPKCGEYFDEEDEAHNEDAEHCDFCGSIIYPEDDQCDCGEGRSSWDEDTW